MTIWGWQNGRTARAGFDTELQAIANAVEHALGSRILAAALEPQQLEAVWKSMTCAGYQVYSYEEETVFSYYF